jgi:hypothetical protein
MIVKVDNEQAEKIMSSNRNFLKKSAKVVWFMFAAFVTGLIAIGGGWVAATVSGILFYGGWKVTKKLTKLALRGE